MTAHAMKGDRERCLAAGMDEYVAKPIRQDKLFDAITRALGMAVAERPGEIRERDSNGRNQMPQESELAAVDWSVALQRAYGDQDLLRDLVETCLLETPQLVDEMHTAIAVIDPDTLCRAAHTLKSHMRILGAAPAEILAFDIEDAAHQGSVQVSEMLAPLEKHIQQIRAELQAFLSDRVSLDQAKQ
jgi:HPt (histidine-containing phosphotransfer) domain-containing protein